MPAQSQILGTIATEEWESVHGSGRMRFKEGTVRELSWQTSGYLCIIFKDETRFLLPVLLSEYQRMYNLLLTAYAQNLLVRIGFTQDARMGAICLQVLEKS